MWASMRTRTRADYLHCSERKQDDGNVSAPSASADPGTASTSDGAERKRRAKNSWNLFMRRMAIGMRGGLPNASNTKGDYDGMSGKEKQQLTDVCTTADEYGCNFGPTTKQTNAVLKRTQVQAMLARDSNDTQLQVDRKRDNTLEVAFKLTRHASMQMDNDSLAKTVRASKWSSRLDAMAHNRAEAHELELLQKWRAGDV